MNCKKCGNVLNPGDTVCSNCNEPVTPVAPTPVAEVPSVAPAAPATSTDASVAPVSQPMSQPVTPTVGDVQPAPVAPTPVGDVQVPVTPVAPLSGGQTPGVQPAPQAPVAQPTAITMAPAPSAQPVQQSVAPVVAPTNKKNLTFYIIVGALALVIVVLIVFIAIKLIGGNSKSNGDSGKKSNSSSTTTSPSTPTTTEEEPAEEPEVASVDKFESGGFTFTIPSDIKSKIDKEAEILIITDNTSFEADMYTALYSLQYIINNIDVEISALRREGLYPGDPIQNYIGGRQYVLIPIKLTTGQDAILYYSHIDYTTVAIGAVAAVSSEGYDSAFDYINKIILTGTKQSNFSPSGQKEEIDYSIIGKTSSDLETVPYESE